MRSILFINQNINSIGLCNFEPPFSMGIVWIIHFRQFISFHQCVKKITIIVCIKRERERKKSICRMNAIVIHSKKTSILFCCCYCYSCRMCQKHQIIFFYIYFSQIVLNNACVHRKVCSVAVAVIINELQKKQVNKRKREREKQRKETKVDQYEWMKFAVNRI